MSFFKRRQKSVTERVLEEVRAERMYQDKKWGEQNHPNGTGGKFFEDLSDHNRKWCDKMFKEGHGTWRDILTEEFHEALAESAPGQLRAELVQVAAVCVSWIEAIDRKARK